MATSMTFSHSRSRLTTLLMMLAGGVAAALLAADDPSPSGNRSAATDRVVFAAGELDQLRYLIITRWGSDASSCSSATPRQSTGVIGTPTFVRVGPGLAADTSVTLAVAPGPAGSTTVDLEVNRLSPNLTRSRVEVVVAPTAGQPERISFGYDGCEAGSPVAFNETITTAKSRLSLATKTPELTPALTLVGSQFTVAPDGTRTDTRTVSARLAPMPKSTQTAIVQSAPESYRATVRARPETNVRLNHAQYAADGGVATVAAEIGSFPGHMDVQLSPTVIDYVATAPFDQPLPQPIDFVDIATTTTSPGDPEQRLRARLEQVPAAGRLERTSDTRVEVTAPRGPIGAATVSYASIPEGTTTLPSLTPTGDQYLVARKIHELLLAQVRVRGLSHAIVDAGNPLAGADPGTDFQTDKIPTVVEATHLAGPFTIDAAVTSRPEESPVDVTRTAVARVVQLPSTAYVEFGATTQSFEYRGSEPIGLLTADVTSTEPFVDDATEAHLTVKNFPTGLIGRFDEDGKRFTARVPSGEIGSIELLTTGGSDPSLPDGIDSLPDGIDGILLEDHEAKYTAFARLTGLRRITVEWGNTMKADVAHRPGPFDVHVDVDDPDTADPETNTAATDLDLDIAVRNLPGEALLEYTASKETECTASPCPKTPSKLKFTGDGPVGSIDLDVVGGHTLIDGGEGNKGATELHGLVKNIPAGTVNVVVDGENKTMTAGLDAPAPDFVVELEACSAGECETPIETLKLDPADPATMDGIWLEDLVGSYHLFGRISGLSNLTLDWSDNVRVLAQKNPGPFDIVVNEDKRMPGFTDALTYGSRTSVKVRDLPATVDLTYFKNVKKLTYNGSDPIGLIEAWLAVDRVAVYNQTLGYKVLNAFVGRATNAHVRITDLPKFLTLSMTVADTGDKSEALSATLDAGGASIGEIYVELTSDESLLSTPAIQAVPVMQADGEEDANVNDGFLAWDIDDGDDDPGEVFEDPYVMVARVTQLRSFHIEKYKIADEYRDSVIMAEADRATRRNIWVDVVKTEATKLPRPLDGIGPEYRYEYLRMGMDVPPNKMRFEALTTRHDNGKFRTLRVVTNADSDATSMTVETDAGSESLTAYVAPVPAGATYNDPGAQACISPGSMDCQPDHRVSYAGSDPVSVSLEVAKPVHIDVVRVERKAFLKQNGEIGYLFPEFHVHMDVEKFMQASSEVDYEYVNEFFLFIDTQGHGIEGDIIDFSNSGPGGGTDLDIHLPPGTEAENRWIKLEGPPRHSEIISYSVGNNPRGEMSCPSGMDIIIDAFQDIDVHVEDEICPEPRIHAVEDGATGQPVVVSRSSNGGQPVTLTMHLYGSGFAPITCSPTSFLWPPCTGPAVRIGSTVNGGFVPDNRFTIVSRTWHWTNHVEVVIEVDPDTPVGPYEVFINNPETGTDTCVTHQVNGEDVPCFSVAE